MNNSRPPNHSRPSLSARNRRRLNQRLERLARAESRALAAELRAIRAEREIYQNALQAAVILFFGVVGCVISFLLFLFFF